MKQFFTYRALQPLSPTFKIILPVFCALIFMSIGIFVTTNQPTKLSIEWTLICSRLVVIDSINFPSTFVKSSVVWTMVWIDLTFQKMTFLRVPPTPSTGPLPWCLSLQNQEISLSRKKVLANNLKINLEGNCTLIPSLQMINL